MSLGDDHEATISLVLFSGETHTIVLPHSSTVLDVRSVAVDCIGYHVRVAKFLVGERALHDAEPVDGLEQCPWHVVFAGERNDFIGAAFVAKEAEQYKEATFHMRHAILLGAELNCEQRNLLSIAYKNAISDLHSAWQVAADTEKVALITEVRAVCNEVLELLLHHLIPLASAAEDRVFYGRMVGHYYSRLAEIADEDSASEAIKKAREAYQEAMSRKHELWATHPVSLGLDLSFARFTYQQLGNTEEACRIARTAFEDGIVFNLGRAEPWEGDYQEITLLLQLLRDDLTCWTAEGDDGHEST